MSPVFGRYSPSPHKYDSALYSLLSSPDISENVMARNVMFDHRVSKEREESFDKYVQDPCTADSLIRACNEYHYEKIRVRTLPDYVYVGVNGNNLLNGHAVIPPKINKDVKLVRALDLNGLAPVFQWARRKRGWGRFIRSFPGPHNERDVMKWLDDIFHVGPAEDFVEVVLDILNNYRDVSAFQPTWATTLSGFSKHLSEPPERWVEAIGVSKPRPCWVILLAYTVREAGTIARPTQLDGGWYCYHFPSPPHATIDVGGHPMDLRTTPQATDVIPEYIHKQIRHTMDHWTGIGSKYGRTNPAALTTLLTQRTSHYQLLVRTYGPSVLTWMNPPV